MSMIRVRGNTKMTFAQRKDIAERYGAKFIKLQHIDGFGDTARSILGFQGVTVSMAKKGNGRVEVGLVYSRNAESGKDVAEGSLQFTPNEMQELIAYLPDTKFNRRALAMAFYGGNPLYTIPDPQIMAEIEMMVEGFKKDQTLKQKEDEVAAMRDSEAKRHEEEKRRLDPKSVQEHRTETNELKELVGIVKDLTQVQLAQLKASATEIKKTDKAEQAKKANWS